MYLPLQRSLLTEMCCSPPREVTENLADRAGMGKLECEDAEVPMLLVKKLLLFVEFPSPSEFGSTDLYRMVVLVDRVESELPHLCSRILPTQ